MKGWCGRPEVLDVEKYDEGRSEAKRLWRYIRGMKREEGREKSRRSLPGN